MENRSSGDGGAGLADVDEVRLDSARCFCWKGGREYHHVGWLQYKGTDCVFQIYEDDAGVTIVTVEQLNACDECIQRVREWTSGHGCELVERRSDWTANTPRSCKKATQSRRLLGEAA